jgi:hypothetical protein
MQCEVKYESLEAMDTDPFRRFLIVVLRGDLESTGGANGSERSSSDAGDEHPGIQQYCSCFFYD